MLVKSIKMKRVAVIGVGNMGKNHARVYSELDDVELVGVVDLDEETGKEIAERFNTKYYKDYKDVLDKVDAVSIVVPTKYHHRVAKDFLEAGVDVLVEKPISRTLEEAEELIKLAEENERVLQVGHIERFNPALGEAKKQLKGEILAIESHRIGPFVSRISDAGVVLDLLIHDIDIILDLAGSKIKNVKSAGRKVYSDHEDYANAILTFENDAVASIIASRCTQKRERKLRITQRDRYIIVDYMNKRIEVHKQAESEYVSKDNSVELIYSDITERPQVPSKEPLKLELESFMAAVNKGEKPLVDGRAGKGALEIALRILEDMK
jgi:predicted dehydrogenase